MSWLRAEAHAKVNLALAVTGRRPDGYHKLRSVFVRLALHDRLEIDVDEDAVGPDTLDVDGISAGPTGNNLVLQAPAYLRGILDGPLPTLRFRLAKRIPAAAGLGGGSSDAAAAVDLTLAAWGVVLHPARRLEVALHLGADVPFFAAGHGASLVSGIGEHLQPLLAPEPPAGILLITPSERLSTADVFDELDREPALSSAAAERVDELAGVLREIVAGEALAASSGMLRDANDLWAPASRLSPTLAAAREAAEAMLRHAVLMTGSGPTLYAIYPSEAVATSAAIELQSERPPELADAEIIATSTVASGGRP